MEDRKAMLKNKLVLLAATALIFGGCNGYEYKLAQTKKPIGEQKVSDRSIEYLILPQDRLEIALYKDPQQGAEVAGALYLLSGRPNIYLSRVYRK